MDLSFSLRKLSISKSSVRDAAQPSNVEEFMKIASSHIKAIFIPWG
jgi:hypothetical protein